MLCFAFPHAYGVVENRLFKEHGDYLPGKHFRIYHLWLAGLFSADAFFAYALSRHLILATLLLVYSPLGLDWVWWLIRYFDFKKDPVEATKSYGEPNAWHLRSDWDNYGKFPLVLRCFLWWWAFAVLCVILGVLAL
jgi:hypothetical protein